MLASAQEAALASQPPVLPPGPPGLRTSFGGGVMLPALRPNGEA